MDPKNWRGLAMLSYVGKLLGNVMHIRLSCLNYWLHAMQGGFRPRRGVYEQGMVDFVTAWRHVMMNGDNLREGALRYKNKRRKLIMVFQDMAAAYDSFPHAVLMLRFARLATPSFLEYNRTYVVAPGA